MHNVERKTEGAWFWKKKIIAIIGPDGNNIEYVKEKELGCGGEGRVALYYQRDNKNKKIVVKHVLTRQLLEEHALKLKTNKADVKGLIEKLNEAKTVLQKHASASVEDKQKALEYVKILPKYKNLKTIEQNQIQEILLKIDETIIVYQDYLKPDFKEKIALASIKAEAETSKQFGRNLGECTYYKPHTEFSNKDYEKFLFVQPYLGNKSLSSFLADTKLNLFSTLFYIRQAVDAVYNIHTKRLVHYDIKPENFVIDTESHQISLVDLAFTTIVNKDGVHAKGTSPFKAPEVEQAHTFGDPIKSSNKHDIYSLGVTIVDIIFQYLGYPPLLQLTQNQTNQILNKINWKVLGCDSINNPTELIKKMLKNPDERPTIEEIKSAFDQLIQVILNKFYTTNKAMVDKQYQSLQRLVNTSIDLVKLDKGNKPMVTSTANAKKTEEKAAGQNPVSIKEPDNSLTTLKQKLVVSQDQSDKAFKLLELSQEMLTITKDHLQAQSVPKSKSLLSSITKFFENLFSQHTPMAKEENYSAKERASTMYKEAQKANCRFFKRVGSFCDAAVKHSDNSSHSANVQNRF